MTGGAGHDLAEVDDATLLHRHVEGDPAAFGVLFARHRDRLWAVALRTCGNPDDAADGLQDGMVAAFRRAGSFRGDAAVTTWLHRVVVNACLDRLRRSKVRATEPLPDDLEERAGRGSLVTGATSGASDPVEAAEGAERRRAVLGALAALTPEQRAALVLVDMEGYSVDEAAALLEVPAGTVKSRCSRGRARLAPLLRDLLDAEGNRPGGSRVPPVGPPPDGAPPGGEQR